MRGEFIRGDGLVLPNNITFYGSGRILDSCFRQVDPGFQLGLCNGVFDPLLSLGALEVPNGNGYEGVNLPSGVANWPNLLQVNGEQAIESRPVVFTATQPYNIPVTRLFIRDRDADFVFALSSPFPAPLLITPQTPEVDRTFRYRLYLR